MKTLAASIGLILAFAAILVGAAIIAAPAASDAVFFGLLR
jgi:hypothetical protein